jgi:hypothetical protein
MEEAQLAESIPVVENPATEDRLARTQRLTARRQRGPVRLQGAREARRATDRLLTREKSRLIRKQNRIDGRIITDRKAWLKRHHGNPTARREALVTWFVAENAKRGYE